MKHEERVLACLYAIAGDGFSETLVSGIPGMAGESLYPVRYNGIVAIAGIVGRERLTLDKSAALAYGEILDTLSENFTVLPCRFGTLLKDDDAITEVLQERCAFYERKLVELKDKKEFGLTILPEKKGAATCNVRNDRKAGDGKEYLMLKYQQFKAELELKENTRSAIDVIRLELQEISSECEGNSSANGQMSFSGSFLVEKKNMDFFCSKVKIFQRRYPELKFLLTGPWPPFSFVS